MAFDKSQKPYKSLRNIIAERTNGVVFWVGSGLSAEAGLPTWDQLKAELLDALYAKADQLNKEDGANLRITARGVSNQSNNWIAFDRLSNALGRTTWRETVRRILDPSVYAPAPQIYGKIWSLNPHGVLSLNLDKLVARSYSESSDNKPLITEFTGTQIAGYTHVLRNPHPFVCNLHGSAEDVSSWILTKTELTKLLESPAYADFVKACLRTKTVVFAGISADDEAVGGFVEQLADLGVDLGSHYWITDRRDANTDSWAENVGIRLIRYNAPNDEHGELVEMFDDLIRFVSPDDLVHPPITPSPLDLPKGELPTPDELRGMDAETIRGILNEEATRILKLGDVDQYEEFTRSYDESMYRAWYVIPDNKLLGHDLHEEVASGAFGRVFRAIDPKGNNVAVKVLHEGIRRNKNMFSAFRRGVRAMEILSHRGVDGMVPYRSAFEIPAVVVMDWVEGPNLEKAVLSGWVDSWELILRIAVGVSKIVRRGHALPERVLHRDIRPTNIMLRDFYTAPDAWDVVVLDFDLSWHRGVLEQSVVPGATALLGYLAPEQIQPVQGVSTRHASVDSFGLGMVLYFMLSKENPVPDQHRHADWPEILAQASRNSPWSEWVSLPGRFARLIELATQDYQPARWDMAQIQSELQRLHDVAINPSSVVSAELVAEEIAARCQFSSDYAWDSNTLSAIKERESGLRFEIQGDETQKRVLVNLIRGDPGVQGRASRGKWIEPAMKNASEILRSSGWHISDAHARYARISVSASLPTSEAIHNLQRTVGSLDRALNEISRFS